MIKTTIKDIAKSVSSGLTPLRSNESYWGSADIAWVKTEQLGQKNIYDSNEKISLKALQETSIKLNPKNTLSIAMYGEGKTRGSVSILKNEMTTNQACCNVVVDPEKADYEYVYYYLTTQYNQLRSLSSGVRKNLNSNDIKHFPIRLPKLPQQKEISNFLTSLDSKISLNNRINQELEAMAKLIYDYWFVQFDFPTSAAYAASVGKPELEGKPYKSSGGKMVYNEQLKREIPEGWEGGVLKNIVDFNPSLSLSRKSESSYIDMNAIPESGFMTGTVQTKEFSGGVKFQNGDVVVARITPCLENGKTGLITLLDDEEIGFGSTEFIVMRGKNKPLTSFRACLSRSEFFRKYAISKMTGTSGRKRVDYKSLEIMPIAIPPDTLLEEFEGLTSRYFDKMTVNTKENQKLSELRDWLLPMLMNGQVKVSSYREATKAEGLSMAAEPEGIYQKNAPKPTVPENKKGFAKLVLAGHIIEQCRETQEFTSIKLQKLIHLSEYMMEADLEHNYYYQIAGPYDNKLMHTLRPKMQSMQWFDGNRDGWTPLPKQDKVAGYFDNYFGLNNLAFARVIEKLGTASEDQCELISTLYAVWNDLIILKEEISEPIITDRFYNWSDRKKKFTLKQISTALSWMKENGFEPRGFGDLIKRKIKGS